MDSSISEQKYQLIKSRLADYAFKKKKAEKYLKIYKSLSGRELFRAGNTLLTKAEKWGKKAQEAYIVYTKLTNPTLLDKVKEKIGL